MAITINVTEKNMLHVEFSENDTCKYTNETQALHFGGSYDQSSLHTGVLYVGKIPFRFALSQNPGNMTHQLYGPT